MTIIETINYYPCLTTLATVCTPSMEMLKVGRNRRVYDKTTLAMTGGMSALS